MPDMHSLVGDMEMAKREFVSQIALCLRWLDDIGLDCVPAIRFVRSFLDENPGFVEEVMNAIGRPALVEVWDERFFYFVAKFEMNFVDTAKKAACLSTVQIDVENTERFDINYVAPDGTKKHPLLMHTSVSGSLDRNVFAILENQAMRVARGEKAFWPFWLAPTQVRPGSDLGCASRACAATGRADPVPCRCGRPRHEDGQEGARSGEGVDPLHPRRGRAGTVGRRPQCATACR